MMENNLTLKTYMAVMAERDAAIRERNVAMEERRQALAERDMAMTQRDSALAERNTALEERDKALNALDFCESPRNEYNLNPDSQEAGVGVSQELEYMYNEDLAEAHRTKTKKGGGVGGKQRKEKGVGAGSKKKGRKRGCEEMINQVNTTESTTSDIWDSVDFGDEDGDDLEQHFAAWNQNSMGLKEVEEEEEGGYDDHDESALPQVPPVCSCGGVSQPCYKLGNGGWQSSCCTSTNNNMPMAMYHHQHQHQSNNKRAGVVAGRRISGIALSKLINRLVAEERHDPSMPLDLKDHWDQHETTP